MKNRVAGMAMVFVLLGVYGCPQTEQKQKPVSYTGMPAPSIMQIEQLQQAAQTTPKNAQGWITLGDSLMDAQRFSEAITAYDKSLALEPKNVPVLVDQGTCYRGVGKFDKAVEQYQKAMKIDPNFPNAHRNLGVVLAIDLNKKQEGIKEFQRYLELVPNSPDADGVRQTIRELQAMK